MKLSKRQLRKIIRETNFSTERKLNLDIIEELREAEDGIPTNALYNVIFKNVDPQMLTDEIDHLVEIGYAEYVGDVLYLGNVPPSSQFAPKRTMENTTKITKGQLKRIIREAIGTGMEGSVSLDHVINCYVNGMSDEECADDMPQDVNIEELQDFANFILRATNIYRDIGNF